VKTSHKIDALCISEGRTETKMTEKVGKHECALAKQYEKTHAKLEAVASERGRKALPGRRLLAIRLMNR